MIKKFPRNLSELFVLILLFWSLYFISIKLGDFFFTNDNIYKKFAFEYIFSFGIIIIITIFYNFKRYNYIPKFTIVKNIHLIYLILILIFLITAILYPLNSFFFKNYVINYNPYSLNSYGILMPLLLAPILEEFLFRGIIQKGLETKYSKVFSIAISLLLFILIHQSNQYISAFIIGLFFSIIYSCSNNLFYPVILHIIANNITFFHEFLIYKNIHLSLPISFICLLLLIIILKKNGTNYFKNF